MTDSTGASVSLDGTYQQACSSKEKDTSEIVISGNNLSVTYTLYTDDACATARYVYKGNLTFVVGSSVTAATGETANQITLTHVSQGATNSTDASTAESNEDGAYGFTDWVTGTEKDITGLNYDDGSTNSTSVAGYVFYDLWYIV